MYQPAMSHHITIILILHHVSREEMFGIHFYRPDALPEENKALIPTSTFLHLPPVQFTTAAESTGFIMQHGYTAIN